MVVRTCERCSKEFKLKGDYTRHMNRKKPCKESIKNIVNDGSQIVHDGSQIVNDVKNIVNDGSQIVNDGSQIVNDVKNIVNDGSQIVHDGSQIVNDVKNIVNDGSQIVHDGSQIVNDGSQIVNDGSQIVNDVKNIVNDGSQIVNDGSQIVNDGSRYTCIYCNKSFCRNNSMHRHMRSYCKIKKQQDKLKQELYDKLVEQKKEQDDRLTEKKKLTGKSKRKLLQEELEKKNKEIEELDKKNKEININKQKEIEEISNSKQKEIDELQNKIKELQQQVTVYNTNNTNNTTNNTMNNIIFNIVAFGSEDLKEIVSEKMLNKFLKSGYNYIPHLLKHVNFNEKKPKYHNVYQPSLKDAYVMCYDGNKWNIRTRDDAIDDIMDNSKTYYEDMHEIQEEEMDETMKERFDKCLESLDDERKIAIWKGEIKLMLYNNREMIKKTKKRLEQQEKTNVETIKI
jgi:uncharacterized C2H2 Zn-finger protein